MNRQQRRAEERRQEKREARAGMGAGTGGTHARGMPDPWDLPPAGMPYTPAQVEDAMALLMYGLDLRGTPFEHVQRGRW